MDAEGFAMTPLLSDEQRQALHKSGAPLEVRDAESDEVFCLVPAEEYRKVRAMLENTEEIDPSYFEFTEHQSPAPSADEWKIRLRKLATRCGVSLSNQAVSSEGLYD
jgi:hypothetical protein